jgi:hypothetical protein
MFMARFVSLFSAVILLFIPSVVTAGLVYNVDIQGANANGNTLTVSGTLTFDVLSAQITSSALTLQVNGNPAINLDPTPREVGLGTTWRFHEAGGQLFFEVIPGSDQSYAYSGLTFSSRETFAGLLFHPPSPSTTLGGWLDGESILENVDGSPVITGIASNQSEYLLGTLTAPEPSAGAMCAAAIGMIAGYLRLRTRYRKRLG